jgi:hypothetical protein
MKFLLLLVLVYSGCHTAGEAVVVTALTGCSLGCSIAGGSTVSDVIGFIVCILDVILQEKQSLLLLVLA